jgi:hypothetical protein
MLRRQVDPRQWTPPAASVASGQLPSYQSGLGIWAQRAAVANYLNGGNRNIIAEFSATESGKCSDRPALVVLGAAAPHGGNSPKAGMMLHCGI